MEQNRLKVVLVERTRTCKWIAEILGENGATVSCWCVNVPQPSLKTLFAITKALAAAADMKKLLTNTTK